MLVVVVVEAAVAVQVFFQPLNAAVPGEDEVFQMWDF